MFTIDLDNRECHYVISNWLINQKSLCFSAIYLICLCFRAVYLLLYDWSWYVSNWAGIHYSNLNRHVFPDLTFVNLHQYSLFFYPKKRFHFFFCKTVKITLLRRSHFYRWPNFFLHRPQIMVVFTVLANFLVQFHPRKSPFYV